MKGIDALQVAVLKSLLKNMEENKVSKNVTTSIKQTIEELEDGIRNFYDGYTKPLTPVQLWEGRLIGDAKTKQIPWRTKIKNYFKGE